MLSPDEATAATRIAMPEDYINGLVEARNKARAARDWAEADRIRSQLAEVGVRLIDTPQGTRWEPLPVED